MHFVIGFAIWLVLGVVFGAVMPRIYPSDGTAASLSTIFGVFGAFIGGMLGTSAHIFHDATPLRIGGLIGAFSGAIVFSFLYHFIARKAV